MFISSGKMGGYGKHGRQAIQLAIDEINADGGVLGRNMEAAIKRAGTTKADKVIEAMEKGPLSRETPEGWKTMRSEDHSVVEDCLWGQTSPNATYGFAIPKSFESIQGEEICRTDEELKAVREEYMKRPK
jgi:hypothetical protein